MKERFTKPTEDYLRVMTASPEAFIADVPANVRAALEEYEKAKNSGAELLVLPELGLSGYTTADLFFNSHVLEQTIRGLAQLAQATKEGPAMVIGAPLERQGILYNCAAILADGKIACVVPKSYLPNYGEFYEKRWFTSGKDIKAASINIEGQEAPFGTDLLFSINGTTVGVEVCEDVWAPISPSTYAALAGAEVIVNISASNELIGKTEYRRNMLTALAGKLICAYIYTSSGAGESVADVVYGGHQMIIENGRLSREQKPLEGQGASLVYDIDREELLHDRLTNKTFADQAVEFQNDRSYRRIELNVPSNNDPEILRDIDPYPFVPRNPEELDLRCEQIFNQMATSLAQRACDANSDAIVLGLSGGLDSTLALLTAIRASEILGAGNDFVHTLGMPGPASSKRTQDNAKLLAEVFGTTYRSIPIGEMTADLLSSIGHDGQTEDVTYENTQSRIRTALLMNYANMVHGFVEGTGDMSENAQGWCTFNGDQMSMFNPNTSVPKTLVRHLVSWYAKNRTNEEVRAIMRDILATPVSPELTGNGDLSQATEEKIGPYDLNDFNLYHLVRRGSRPEKVGYLATRAFNDAYDQETIEKWLYEYLGNFTRSQWKRDIMPNGPKIGTVSLSPRGDWRMAPNTSSNWYKA